ncbi:MAG TPA: M23 family metallopeptidase [Gemmatimonadaceae bacterium]|nr:M23 family metallopeptidase [Gemmatimonadaceae bacterium]
MTRPVTVLLFAAATPAVLLSTLLAPPTFASPPTAPVSRQTSTPSPCAGVRLVAAPERPRQGALFRVRVEGAPAGAELRGRVAGEPLHFAVAAGAHEALAAAPIDADSPLRVAVACSVAGRTDSLGASVVLTAADYPLERLRVAPRFSAPPDSALAERMRRESAMAAEVSRRSHDTPRLWTEPFRRPRESRVTSVFGRGREFNGTVTSRHLGTDYAGAVGAPVRAANRGVVRLVDSFFLGGNVVYLDHGAGIVTAYLHLSEQNVAPGDTVQRGDIIGKVGATGRVTGPHLHWITRYGGVTVDPASMLRVTAANGEP